MDCLNSGKIEGDSTESTSDRIKSIIKNARDSHNLRTIIKNNYKLNTDRKMKEGSLQLILAFDTTGSMGEYRKIVRDKFDYIASNLTDMLENIQIAFVGVGEYCDTPYTLQMTRFEKEKAKMRENLYSIKDTQGGGSCQVSLELLFEELNSWDYNKGVHSLVVVSDQIPHGMDHKEKYPRANYNTELIKLKKKMSFYFVSVTENYTKPEADHMREMQRTMVDHDKYFLDLKRIETLPTLIIAMSMSEVGRLDYMMQHLRR